MIPPSFISSVEENGWASLDIAEPTPNQFPQQFLDFARSWGTPVAPRNTIDSLSPTPAEKAHRNTLSKAHGVGEFPLHIDTSHWATPARFVLLGCLSPGSGNRPTLLHKFEGTSLTAEMRDLFQTAPFRILNGRHSFFSTVIAHNRRFVRFDPGCMVPMCQESEEVLQFFSRPSVEPEYFTWKSGRVLLIDNWRVLHGRGQASETDSDRVLLRITLA